MTILHATKDLRKVSLWLGDASVQTTEIYTHADPTPKLRTGRFKATDKYALETSYDPAPAAWIMALASPAHAEVVPRFYDVFLLLVATGFFLVNGLHGFESGSLSK